MHRAVVAELLGQLVPLAACAHPDDDPVENRSPLISKRWQRMRKLLDSKPRLEMRPEIESGTASASGRWSGAMPNSTGAY